MGRAESSITDLAEKFDMTLTGMRKHAGVLEEAGLVVTECSLCARCIPRRKRSTKLVLAQPMRHRRRSFSSTICWSRCAEKARAYHQVMGVGVEDFAIRRPGYRNT